MTDRFQQTRAAGPHRRILARGSVRRTLLALALSTGAAVASPAAALQPVQIGQGEAAKDLPGDELAAQCERLRQELARANAEISDLKRGDRGVRDDYRLRRRMADAEQLARQLTAAEAQLRRLRGPAPVAPVPAARPALEPTEAPGVLEARADLLSDQARRLNQEAAGLERAATQLRTRQTLRQRAGQVERDPFGSMDSSKRFMVVRRAQESGGPGDTNVGGGNNNTFKGTPTQTAGLAQPGQAPPPGGAETSGGTGTTAPTPGQGVAPPTTPSPTAAPQPAQPQPTATDSNGGGTRNGGGPTGTTLGTPTRASEITSRTLLDPAIAAELKRMDAATGAPTSEAERLQRAAAALNKRAQTLEAEARALRTRAQKR